MPLMVLSVFSFGCRGKEDTSADICVRGVPAKGRTGSQEVTDFFTQELRLPKLAGKWQKRTLHYLRNRCGHRFLEEGAVSKAQEEISSQEESCCEGLELQADDVSLQQAGTKSYAFLMTSRPGHPVTSALCHRPAGLGAINTSPASQGDNSSRIVALNTSLSLSIQQQQPFPPPMPKSLLLSSLEREAIRTCGRPWSGCPAFRLPRSD